MCGLVVMVIVTLVMMMMVVMVVVLLMRMLLLVTQVTIPVVVLLQRRVTLDAIPQNRTNATIPVAIIVGNQALHFRVMLEIHIQRGLVVVVVDLTLVEGLASGGQRSLGSQSQGKDRCRVRGSFPLLLQLLKVSG